jgi:hypothetical protein
MAKPMAISLPLVLFLMDWMAGRRLTTKRVLEKTPFVLAVWMIAAITMAINLRNVHWTFPKGILLVVYTSTFYVSKFFLPVDLATIYPVSRNVSLAQIQYSFPLVLLAVIIGVLWYARRNRWVIFAFLFYSFSMFFLWRSDLFDMAKGLVNDRYMYIPCIGFTLLLGKLYDRVFLNSSAYKLVGWFLPVLFCASLAVITYNRCFIWHDSLTFWNDVLRIDPDNVCARINRAESLISDHELVKNYKIPEAERYKIAMSDLRKAILRAPKDADAWQNLGVCLYRLGHNQESEDAFLTAARLGYEVSSKR